MPRCARAQSDTGIYHVMLRGINRQQIFEDEQDRAKFLQILRECKHISEFKLYAYCLMGNHIHLLIAPGNEPLHLIFRRIGVRFVYWYNIKYRRNGHLFQDRYKSEPIIDDSQFIAAWRYILQNPVKGGLSPTAEQYPHSSAASYVGGEDDRLTDVQLVLDLLPGVNISEFLQENSGDDFLDVAEKAAMRLTDEQAGRIISEVSGCENASEFQMLPPESRDKYLHLLSLNGLSIRQISRATGISKGIVERVTRR